MILRKWLSNSIISTAISWQSLVSMPLFLFLSSCTDCPLDPCCDPTAWPPTCGFDIKNETGLLEVTVKLQCSEQQIISGTFYSTVDTQALGCRRVRCDDLENQDSVHRIHHAAFGVDLRNSSVDDVITALETGP